MWQDGVEFFRRLLYDIFRLETTSSHVESEKMTIEPGMHEYET